MCTAGSHSHTGVIKKPEHTCYHQAEVRLSPGLGSGGWVDSKGGQVSQGLLNCQAVRPLQTRWQLCVSRTEEEVPPLTWQAPASLLWALSISSQGHLAQQSPVLFGKNW